MFAEGSALIINNEVDIIQLVREDEWMMDVLKTAKSIQLPDWWVCAGFVRSKIWDVLHGFDERTPLPDVDVIYFDESNIDEAEEKKWEEMLKRINPEIPWSVKNEARMHLAGNLPPYSSAVDAISKFPETATALGLSLDEQNNVVLAAPCGIEDVVQLVLQPTPFFKQTEARAKIYEERMAKKNWKRTWNKIKVSPIQQTDQV